MLSIIDIVQITQNYNFWNVASLTVVIYDYLICLPVEIELVWPTRWSPGKVLYFATRYSAFIDNTILVFFSNENQSVQSCERVFIISSWFTIIGIVISETVLVFRTYAVWERNAKLFGILLVVLAGAVVFCLVFARISLANVEFGTMAEGYPPGCWLVEFLNPIILFDFVIVLCFEIVILILTLFKCRQAIKRGRSKLLITLHRDAILYCFFIVVCSIANIINQVVPSSAISPSFEEMQRVMHSVLTSRILLNLRQAVRVNEEKATRSTTMSWDAPISPERGGSGGRRNGRFRTRARGSSGRSRPFRRGSRQRRYGDHGVEWNVHDSSRSSSSGLGSRLGSYLSAILDLDEETWTHDEESARRVETGERGDIEMADLGIRDEEIERSTSMGRRRSEGAPPPPVPVVLDLRADYYYGSDSWPSHAQAQASSSSSRI